MAGRIINSLFNPNDPTPAERRIVADSTTATGTPSGPLDGFHTKGNKWLHIVTEVSVGGTADWRLWVYSEMAGLWCLDTQLGTAGTVPITFAAPNPTWNVRELDGVERVFVEVLNHAGGASVNVWAGTIGGFGNADG